VKRVSELFHRAHGYLVNLTGAPIQVGGIVGGFILEPSFRVESAEKIPAPAWELCPNTGPGVIYTDDRTGLYSRVPEAEGVRPGNYGGRGPHIYAPIIYVIPEELRIPPERTDVIYPWQL
jgi:hypothetical protein